MNKLFLSLAVIAILAGCSEPQNVQSSPTGTLPPVETKAPNSPQYKPAFVGQTRVAGVKTKTPLDVQVLATSLVKPWAVISMPDGRLLITEKGGTFRIATTSGTLTQPITGAPKVDDAGQGGLLDVALDPDFTTNRVIY